MRRLLLTLLLVGAVAAPATAGFRVGLIGYENGDMRWDDLITDQQVLAVFHRDYPQGLTRRQFQDLWETGADAVTTTTTTTAPLGPPVPELAKYCRERAQNHLTASFDAKERDGRLVMSVSFQRDARLTEMDAVCDPVYTFGYLYWPHPFVGSRRGDHFDLTAEQVAAGGVEWIVDCDFEWERDRREFQLSMVRIAPHALSDVLWYQDFEMPCEEGGHDVRRRR